MTLTVTYSQSACCVPPPDKQSVNCDLRISEVPMALRESPFANGFIAGLHSLSWWLIFPCFWFMDRMIAVCLTTTLEKKQRREEECYLGPLRVFFGLLIFLALFMLTAPVALIGFLMWVPLQAARRPFIYSQRTTTNPEEGAVKNLAEGREGFGFVTANLCLLPDSLARFNNLGHSQARANLIGKTIVQSVNRPQNCVVSPSSDTMSHCSRDNLLASSLYYGSIDSQPPSRPCLGFDSSLPLEEVVCFNSGLFFASRYPVLDASFHCYPNGRGEDALAAKGLLSVKVQVGRNSQKNIVGYFNCTHLHAPEADGEIRSAQLTLVSKWISDFQALAKRDDEIVVFDILCGDFNFDNCSPDDSHEQKHKIFDDYRDPCRVGPGQEKPWVTDDSHEQKHKIFDDYRDPCRVGPGQEKPWVTGTLLEQPTMYDEEVLTPESLQRSLANEAVRRRFIAPPVGLDGGSCDSPDPGAPWVGRRIDYMLYREATLSQLCKTDKAICFTD
ncbi:UNVERIFIED_CONTAM: hypothetical protein FKN15_074442 [Acipenser sinensis]